MNKKNGLILAALIVLVLSVLTTVIAVTSDIHRDDRVAGTKEQVLVPKNPSDDPVARGNAPAAGQLATVDSGGPLSVTLDKDLTGTPGLTGNIYIYTGEGIAAIEITREGYDALLKEAGYDPHVSTQIYLTERAAVSVGYKSSSPINTFVLTVQR
jgi:hypothetical protein